MKMKCATPLMLNIAMALPATKYFEKIYSGPRFNLDYLKYYNLHFYLSIGL